MFNCFNAGNKKKSKVSVFDYSLYIRTNQKKNKELNVFQFDILKNKHFRESTTLSHFTITCMQYIIHNKVISYAMNTSNCFQSQIHYIHYISIH